MSVLLAGLLTGWALIVAIGAQNAYVLRQGLRREHVGSVLIVCIVADVVLIAAAVAGVGVLLERAPWLTPATRIAGGAFLIGYGIVAGVRALRGGPEVAAVDPMVDPPGGAAQSVRRVLLTISALTFLNPHLYLDLVLLGAVANQHGPQGRWMFYAGMIVASVSWFLALGFGSRLLAPYVRSPRAWRALDGGVAVTMLALGGGLILTG